MNLTPFLKRIDKIDKNLASAEVQRQISEVDEDLKKLLRSIPVHQTKLTWIDVQLGHIGEFSFPSFKKGEASSIDTFCSADLFVFLSYYENRMSNNIFIDIGSNIGLHTLVAKLCGYKTIAFEPDPDTYLIGKLFLEKNSIAIQCINSELVSEDLDCSIESAYIQAAALDKYSKKKFVKLLDNPFGNHIEGLKENVYGNIDEIIVKTIDINKFINKSYTAKLDAEGSDSIIFTQLIKNQNFNKHYNTIYLCDWRDETRSDIFKAFKNIKAKVEYGPNSNSKIESLLDTPKNKSTDYIKVKSELINE